MSWYDGRRMRSVGLLFVLGSLVTTALASPPHASAQADEEARNEAARQLFQSGLEQGQAGRWADAEERFSRALELRWAGPIAYNLAHARVELGRLVDALDILDEILASNGEIDAEVRAASVQLRDGLLSKVARITVQMDGATDGVEITIDGRTVQAGQPIVVDPGRHRVLARLEGSVVGRASPELGEGESTTVVLSGLAASAVADEYQPVDENADDGGMSAGAVVGVTLTVVALVAAAIVIAVLAPFGGEGPNVDYNWGDPIEVMGPEMM